MTQHHKDSNTADNAIEPQTPSYIPNLHEKLYSWTPFEGFDESATPDQTRISPDGAALFLLSEGSELICVDPIRLDARWTLKAEHIFERPMYRFDRGQLSWCDQIHEIKTGTQSEQFWAADVLPEEYTPRDPYLQHNSNTGRFGLHELGNQYACLVWDRQTQTGFEINKGREELESYAFSFDDSLLTISGMSNDLMIYHLETQTECLVRTDLNRVIDMSFSPDNQYLFVIHDTFDTCTIIHIPSNTIIDSRTDTSAYTVGVTWHPQNHYVLLTRVGAMSGYGGCFELYSLDLVR